MSEETANTMTANARTLLLVGTFLAFSAVALGAFGGHALEAMVAPERLDTWQTAVRYQMFHAISILFLGLLIQQFPSLRLIPAGWCLASGTLAFSGSLYLLVLSDISLLGALTPMGGILFLIGWALLGWQLFKHSVDRQ